MSTCHVPFNQLYVHSSGEVYPCSFVQNDPRYVLGHIQKQSLNDIWHSEELKVFREKHLGILPERCEINQGIHSCHKTSLRRNFDLTGNKVKRLDIMLDSACNLTCQMCTNIYDRTGGLKDQFFWENNDETFANVEEIELVGGEPLISPYFAKLVSLVVPLNNKCDWRITTNAHYTIDQKLLNNFKAMNLKTLSISLDSLKPDVFETIRRRSNFKTVWDNIQLLKKEIPFIHINMVVQSSNCDEIVPLYEWTRDQGFHFYPIFLVHPMQFSLGARTKEENKKWIISLLEKNEKLQSKEILFLIRKGLKNLGFDKDKEVMLKFMDHLRTMEAVLV